MRAINISGEGNLVVTQSNGVLYINGEKQDTGESLNITILVSGNLNGDLSVDHGSVDIDGDVKGDVDTVNGDITCSDIGGSVQTVNGDVSAESISGNVKSVNGDIGDY